MNNTAEIIKFQKFERPVVKADIEDGFDRVAGKITDTLMNPPVKLSAREYQVIHAIISKTYRYHKKTDWIASIQLSELTGISQTNISKIKTSLLSKNVIIQDGKRIGINPIISDWTESKIVKINCKTVENDCNKNSQKRLVKQSKTTSEQSKTTVKTVENDCNNRKTTIQKTILHKTNSDSVLLEIQLPEFLPLQNWKEFIQHRRELKKPLTELAASKFISKITREHQQGFNIIELLDVAISSGYQTTYPPKQNFNQQSNRSKPENFAQKDYGQSTFTGNF